MPERTPRTEDGGARQPFTLRSPVSELAGIVRLVAHVGPRRPTWTQRLEARLALEELVARCGQLQRELDTLTERGGTAAIPHADAPARDEPPRSVTVSSQSGGARMRQAMKYASGPVYGCATRREAWLEDWECRLCVAYTWPELLALNAELVAQAPWLKNVGMRTMRGERTTPTEDGGAP